MSNLSSTVVSALISMDWWLIFYLFIQEADEPALECLEDITTTLTEKSPMGFSLHFHFKENEYFTNSVLTKEYHMKCEPMVRFIHFIFFWKIWVNFLSFIWSVICVYLILKKLTYINYCTFYQKMPNFLISCLERWSVQFWRSGNIQV